MPRRNATLIGGLAHYEVRSWVGWHHHMTLALLALWFLVRERRRLGEINAGRERAATARGVQPAATAAAAEPGADCRARQPRVAA